MITCQVCAHDNTLGTVFCRSCGTRLVVDYESIEQSVHKTKVADRDHALLQSGRSAMLLGSFALVCALIARYVVVPPMLSIVPPPAPVLDIFVPPAAPAPTR